MLAKLGSGYKKPNAQTILRPAAVASFIGPMPFQKIGKLGGKLGDTVRERFPAETVDQLLAIDLEDFQDKLGADSGMWLWEIIRGIDSTAVEARIVTSSMLASKNFRPSIQTLDKIQPWLGILATELYHRLTEARELRKGLWVNRTPPFGRLDHRADCIRSAAAQDNRAFVAPAVHVRHHQVAPSPVPVHLQPHG